MKKRHSTIASIFTGGLLLYFNLPASSAPPPRIVGTCSNTFIQQVTSRFGAETNQFGSDSGILHFTNGVVVYLYRSLRTTSGWGISHESQPISLSMARRMFSTNDPVKLCLEYVPSKCREISGDPRGDIYYISDYITNDSAYGHVGRNGCGGA